MFASVQKYNKWVVLYEITSQKSASIIISAFYRPPIWASAESAKCVVDELHDIRINHPICEFWVSGDFNLPDIDWSNHTIKYCQYPKSMSL